MSDVITRLLIQSRPELSSLDTAFTDKVMHSVMSPEIFTTHVRKMNVKRKDTFIMKLQTLPIAAIIALAFGVALLLGGTSYAVYKLLWEQPTVRTQSPTKNQFGRTQVIASLEKCGDQEPAATFEIKSGSTLDPGEIQKILQARCEYDVIHAWSGVYNPSVPFSEMYRPSKNDPSTATIREMSMVASKVVSLNTNSLTLTGDEFNSPKSPLTVSSKTRFYVDGHIATANDIKTGDGVVYIEDSTYKLDKNNFPDGLAVSKFTTDVIKVSLPFEYYGPSKQNQIAQRQPCEGNRQDSCIQAGSINLYENLGAGTTNGDDSTSTVRTIQGAIMEHTGDRIKIKSSSGRIFTVTLPRDIVSSFNLNRSSSYNNAVIELGDMLNIDYRTDSNSNTLDLNEEHIFSVNLALNLIQKDDPIKKY